MATSDVFGGRSVVGESSPSHKRLPSADREVPLLVLWKFREEEGAGVN